METQRFMPEVSLKERREMLHAQADKILTGTYYKPLTDEELALCKDTLATEVEAHSVLSDEKAELVKGLNEQIKAKKEKVREVLRVIKSRQIEKTGTTYELLNHVNSMVEVYDEDGEMLYSRRMRPDERQYTIHSSLRAIQEEV